MDCPFPSEAGAMLYAVLSVATSISLFASGSAISPTEPSKPEPTICKNVVSAEPGSKPYKMCMTKAEWAAKKKADAKNPNRIVCRYEDSTGNRLKAYKICMTAAEWVDQRQRERDNIEQIQRKVCVPGGGC